MDKESEVLSKHPTPRLLPESKILFCILSRVKQITSPGWMHETSTRAWCTGKTQRNQVKREVGGGSGWGIHVNPWLIHVNVWQKPLQYCKVISLQLIKINEKKKREKKKKKKKRKWSCSVMSNSLQLHGLPGYLVGCY